MGKKRKSQPSAMAFYHPDGLVPAWTQATKFAGSGGHIATLPDIVEARLATSLGDPPWETWFTTASAEYFGKSKGGNEILIVAHGVGPMATLEGVLSAYAWEFKDKSRQRSGGRISSEEFAKLESGAYGNIDVVDVRSYVRRRKYPFIGILTWQEAKADPLLLARLGKHGEQYIDYQARLAMEWHRQQVAIEPENRFGTEESTWNAYRTRRRKMHVNQSYEGLNPSGHGPYILKNDAAANCPYGYKDNDDSWISALEKRGGPFGHLLSIGRLFHTYHESFESLAGDVSCHEWWNSNRFVGVRQNSRLETIHQGVDVERLLRKHWQSLLKPVKGSVPVGFRFLQKIDQRTWFTEIPKKGAGLDTNEPEFHVTEIAKIGEPVIFTTRVLGYYGFFKYDIAEVRSLAPKGANAYCLAGDPEVIRGGEYQNCPVQFYRVKVDTSQRLVRATEIYNDFDALMNLEALEK